MLGERIYLLRTTMTNTNLDLSTRPASYPTVMYNNNVVTVPIHPRILDNVVEELQETVTDETLDRAYLEQLIAEHQAECIMDHHVLNFIEHTQTETNGFLGGYTDSYTYLVVNKPEVWGGEADWMPWDDTDQYLLTTAYTREVLDIGKSDTADWAIEGLDVSAQAGYIVPVPFPLHSIATEPSITTDPLALAKQAQSLADSTVLDPAVADCLVLLDAINQPQTEAISTTANLLGVGVSEIQGMISDAAAAGQQAHETLTQLSDYDVVQPPESFY